MAKNKRRHGEEAALLTRLAFDLWQMLHPAKTTEVPPCSSQYWERPAPGWIKSYVDAAFHDRDRSAISGVILRDHDGSAC